MENSAEKERDQAAASASCQLKAGRSCGSATAFATAAAHRARSRAGPPRAPTGREHRERRLDQVAQGVRAVEPMLNRRNSAVRLDYQRIDHVGERQRRTGVGHAAEGAPRLARQRATMRQIELHGQSVAERLLQAQAGQIGGVGDQVARTLRT